MRDPETILLDDPGSVVFSRYAEQLAREGRIEEAVDILKRGIKTNPDYAPGYSVLAELLFQLDSEEEAVENLVSALRLDPQIPRDLFRLGTYHLDRDPSKAEPYLKAAYAYDPESEDISTSYEKVRTLIDTGSGDESATAEAQPDLLVGDGDHEETRDVFPAVNGESEFVESGGTIPDDMAFPDLTQKPNVSEKPKDQEFLDMMGEQGGGTIEEELDSLFQSIGAGENGGKFDTDTNALETAGMDLEDVKESDESGGQKITEHPSGGNQPDAMEADEIITDDGENAEKQEIPFIREVEGEEDFFAAVSGDGDKDEDNEIDSLFDTLQKDRGLDITVAGEEGASGEDLGIVSESGEGEESAVEEFLTEFGIVDFEREEEDEKAVLEITDEEEYNLSHFGFEPPDEENIPVLTEEERSELLALTGVSEEKKADAAGAETYGIGDLSLEDLEKPETIDTDDSRGHTGEIPQDSREVMPADTAFELQENDSTGDGIDYSDILSGRNSLSEGRELILPGEADQLSGAEIPGIFPENTGNIMEAHSPESERVEGESGEIPEPHGEEVATSGISGQVISDQDKPSPAESEDTPSFAGTTSDETLMEENKKTGEFHLHIGDDFYNIGNAFNPLNEAQAALINDFISGKEPESEIDTDELSPYSVSDSVENDMSFVSTPDSGEMPNVTNPPLRNTEPESAYEGENLSSEFSSTELFAAFSPDAEEEDIESQSLDDLISLYQNILAKPAVHYVRKVTPEPVVSPVVKRNHSGKREEELKESVVRGGSYTATMAEIYVSQGLINRAMEIYSVLSEGSPDNEQYRTRLVELRRIHDQQPDAS